MRWLVRSTLLVVIAVSAVSDVNYRLGELMRLPVTAPEAIAEYPLVGSWTEITRDGVGPEVFAADGTVTLRFPDIMLGNHRNVLLSGGTSTWEPVGRQGAVYTVVRRVTLAIGIDLGTITVQG